MAGPAVNTPITVLQGVDFAETFLFFNPPANGSKEVNDLVPVSFATATAARLMVKPSSDASQAALLSLTLGSGLAFTAGTITPGPALPGFNNGIIITVTKAQSLAANAGVAIDAYYDLFVDYAAGTSILWARGTFKLAATGTR
jgi:hypothetical protein